MAETLGSLCDKLTIVKLKQWHTEDSARTESLVGQAQRLSQEIDDFLRGALSGVIPPQALTFASNKVYKPQGEEAAPTGGIGELFAELARVNCELWHEQEKVYDFEAVPAGEKNAVVKALAVLNLQRNRCIDAIDRRLLEMLPKGPS